MWHSLAFVAESRRVDEAKLTAFAMANSDKYGIIQEWKIPQVSTAHVDRLLVDFQAMAPIEAVLDSPRIVHT